MTLNKSFSATEIASLSLTGDSGGSDVANFATALSNGKALADDGNLYDSIDTAESNASSVVLIGPGTFNEAVTISTAGMSLIGAGYDTLIDGGTTESAIIVNNVNNVTIRNLSVQSAGGNGNGYRGIETYSSAERGIIENVTVRDADVSGIFISGSDWIVSNCVIEQCDRDGIRTDTSPRAIITDCVMESNVGQNGVEVNADDNIVANTEVTGVSGPGIFINGSGHDSIVIGNRVDGVTNNSGIQTNANSTIVANNRVSDSSGADVDDSSSGGTSDDNLTGGAT